jgi:hypothetical protein
VNVPGGCRNQDNVLILPPGLTSNTVSRAVRCLSVSPEVRRRNASRSARVSAMAHIFSISATVGNRMRRGGHDAE